MRWEAAILTLGVVSVAQAGEAQSRSFRFRDGEAVQGAVSRTHEVVLAPVTGRVYVYCTFLMGRRNPVPYSGGEPRALQRVVLGRRQTGESGGSMALEFGLTDGRNLPTEKGYLTPWVSNGRLDYFGGYARPDTPYDFRICLDLDRQVATVWYHGRGDDDWFLLIEDEPLASPITAIDEAVLWQYPGAAGVRDLVVQDHPWPPGEALRPHPKAKPERVVKPDAGFRFQAMRSTWRLPGRHVTIGRRPPTWMGFPDVVQIDEHTLVCAHNDGAGHGGWGRLLVRRSDDLGRTWSEPQALLESAVNCPRLQRLRDGSLLVLADVGSTTDPVLFDSLDGGRTWVNQRTLVARRSGGNQACVPSRISELQDGSWLLVGSWYPGSKAWEGTEGERLEFFRSTDRGRTWAMWSYLQAFPPHSLSEASILTLPDGRLMLYAREARGDGFPGVKAYSSDNGKTWTRPQDLPFAITGRTCAGFLRDGRVLMTFRSGIGRSALWAWVGEADDETEFRIAGAHLNDRHSVGLRDGALHIDNDAACGEFTQYFLRPPDSPQSTIDLTCEVKVVASAGEAATISIPFVGRLRLLPDHVELSHAPAVGVDVAPGEFHTYRLRKESGKLKLWVDGEEALVTDRLDGALERCAWTPAQVSVHAFSFGNEPPHNGSATNVYARQLTSATTGYSVWRRVEVLLDDPATGRRELSWSAARGGFPDQYQLDHIMEVDATADGHDQGYSGWVELSDGRLFFVNYTDDTAPTCPPTGVLQMGVSWIRGTFVRPEELPDGGAGR